MGGGLQVEFRQTKIMAVLGQFRIIMNSGRSSGIKDYVLNVQSGKNKTCEVMWLGDSRSGTKSNSNQGVKVESLLDQRKAQIMSNAKCQNLKIILNRRKKNKSSVFYVFVSPILSIRTFCSQSSVKWKFPAFLKVEFEEEMISHGTSSVSLGEADKVSVQIRLKTLKVGFAWLIRTRVLFREKLLQVGDVNTSTHSEQAINLLSMSHVSPLFPLLFVFGSGNSVIKLAADKAILFSLKSKYERRPDEMRVRKVRVPEYPNMECY